MNICSAWWSSENTCRSGVLNILKQKPVRLPAWDPMFADEE